MHIKIFHNHKLRNYVSRACPLFSQKITFWLRRNQDVNTQDKGCAPNMVDETEGKFLTVHCTNYLHLKWFQNVHIMLLGKAHYKDVFTLVQKAVALCCSEKQLTAVVLENNFCGNLQLQVYLSTLNYNSVCQAFLYPPLFWPSGMSLKFTKVPRPRTKALIPL